MTESNSRRDEAPCTTFKGSKWRPVYQEWATAKAKLTEITAEERKLRQQLVAVTPGLSDCDQGYCSQWVDNDHRLTAYRPYNYSFRTRPKETYHILKQLPDQCKRAVKIKYEVDRVAYRELSDKDKQLFGNSVVGKPGMVQVKVVDEASSATRDVRVF